MAEKQKTFMDYVEETTDRIEQKCQDVPTETLNESQDVPTENPIVEMAQNVEFKPKADMVLAHKVAERIANIWHTIHHHADFDKFLDIILAALERREDDYMSLIEGIDKKVLDAYARMYGELYNYFIDGYYGDPLGNFYQENFSYGRGGEFYTPFNIAHFMVHVLEPKPEETVIDPCVGSGVMLLAARCFIHEKYGWITSSRYGRNLYGQDIKNTAVKMAKINLYLTDYIYMICLVQDVAREFKEKAGGERSDACGTDNYNDKNPDNTGSA